MELLGGVRLGRLAPAPLRSCGAGLGTVTAEAAARTGLPRGCAVGVGGHEDLFAVLAVVQRVEEPRRHSCGIAERRVRRDVIDALAIDPYRATIAQALDVALTGHRALRLLSCYHYVPPGGVFSCVFGSTLKD